MKDNMLQSNDVSVSKMRVLKFQIDSQNFDKFATQEVVWILMRPKKSLRMMILITIKSPNS